MLVMNRFNTSNVSPFRASSVNEDYEFKIVYVKNLGTMVESQGSLI